MFFAYPFGFEAPKREASEGRSSLRAALPMLPAPSAGVFTTSATSLPQIFAEAAGQIASYGVEILRRTASSYYYSLTALSNGANVFFAQIAAALSAERAARETAALFGTVWPSFSSPKPIGFSQPSLTAWSNPFMPSMANAWMMTNPWGAFAQAAEMWSAMWMMPFATPLGVNSANSLRSRPQMATLTGPGFMLGLAWHPQS